jgi:hypothetical protein
MASPDIKLIIDYENGNIKFVSDQAEDQLADAGEKGGKKFGSNFSSSSKNSILPALGKIAAAATAIGGIVLFKAAKDAAQLEVINTQFEVMLKSSSAAQKQVEELQDFAASTPFQLTGLAEATKQLLSFGVAQTEILPTLQQLGDIAAGVGADITDLTIPFGRLVSTQKLTLQELDKFADRGVNIYAQLAKQTGRSLKTIRDDISRGRIPFEEFTKSIAQMTGESGIFFKGMEKQSETLTGVISTLGDNAFNLSANLGKTFSPLIISGAKALIGLFQDLNEQVTKTFNIFDHVVEPMLNFNDALITYVAAPLEQLINIANVVQAGINVAFARIVSGIGNLGSAIAFVLDKLGIGENLAEGLKTFEASSEEVANNVQQDFTEAIGNIADFPISDALSTKNTELRGFFQNQRAIIEEEGATTAEATKAQVAAVVEQSQTFGEVLTGTFNNVRIGITQTKEQMAKVAAQTASIMKNGLAKGISGGIQNIVTSLAKGEDVFSNFGKFLLSTIGDLAVQLGSFFIAQGIAVEAMNAVSGTGAIAAGAALVALGSLLKAASGGGGASASAGGGGGSSSTPTFQSDEPTGEFLEEGAAASTPQTVVNFNVDGNIKGDADFIRDTVEGISEEGGKQGLVFNNFAIA